MEITVKVNRYVDSLKEVTYYLVSVNAREGLLRNDNIEKVLGTSYRDVALAHGGFIENGNEVYFKTREEAEVVRDILKDMLREKYSQEIAVQLFEQFEGWDVLEAKEGVAVIAKDMPDQDEQPIMTVISLDGVYLLQVPGTEGEYANLAGFKENREQYADVALKHGIMHLSNKGIVTVADDADEIMTWDTIEELSDIYKQFHKVCKEHLRVIV
ncbi:hypothetical protein DFP93_101181 [Aneurinibacillus soli]|uniref:Uncharacterized protein n=1 Tax=Aneurinibacillus soli TaxID=1500254 RepID=A0A0U4WHI1_9BACL|nr:hypothetical protein [Aneurinibacillus soli]PYE64156.1 hypothetical protein DFP93_101181 [Aneurinibacillus soli]BAU28105.1 hypothetical protein CB4_02279 [Aneurinibacillus soli]